MQINSISGSQGYNKSYDAGSTSPVNENSEQDKDLDNEIQSLTSQKSNINNQINSIKSDFAPTKPKDQLINPLKSELQSIEAKIQQLQAKKLKKTKGKSEPSKIKASKKAPIKEMENLVTQTGFINKGKVKNSLVDTGNKSRSNLSKKKSNINIKNAINKYNKIENYDTENYTTEITA